MAHRWVTFSRQIAGCDGRTLLAVGVLLAAFSGCRSTDGPPRASISGKVTFDGKPVEEGSIVFIPTEGTTGPSSGGQIKQGVYTVGAELGPVVGTNRVEITAFHLTGRKLPAGSPSPPGTMVDEILPYIPPQYNRDSTLKIEIKPGDNAGTDFDLKPDAGKPAIDAGK